MVDVFLDTVDESVTIRVANSRASFSAVDQAVVIAIGLIMSVALFVRLGWLEVSGRSQYHILDRAELEARAIS